ncbi:MAG: hypothetical protein ACD_45C00605G0004 [uncultured bacterium]|nr:MAG: hypothetical protein ACD_45C00605G0004 [uncultured bacterium]
MPGYVVLKMQSWADDIEHRGLREVRKIPGYHDEPLHGKRTGQRSVRLTKAYRAIYVIGNNGALDIIKVIEVNKHDY